MDARSSESSRLPTVPTGARSPDDLLPPVEPPSAGFILQLFLIPAVIVAIIVGVWLTFNWLAQGGGDPYEYLKALERNNPTVRWQAAHQLAGALAKRSNSDLRRDAVVANRLVEILDRELESGRLDEDAIQLRGYLCTALGQFERPELVVPVLVKTVGMRRGDDEDYVRFAAIRAIKQLAEQATNLADAERTTILTALTQAADDPRPVIRSSTAFALGAVQGAAAESLLNRLAHDAYPDVRYNAALMLCRLGDPGAVPMLVEMLDPREVRGIEAEADSNLREQKRAAIVENALRASGELLRANRTADLSLLRQALDKLRAETIPRSLELQIDDVLHQYEQRATLKP